MAGPSQDEKFATLAVAVLDPASHQVTVVSAGHLSPVILKTTGRLEEAVPRELTGFPLAIIEDYRYESCRFSLLPGDSFIMFTKGATEALSQQSTSSPVTEIRKVLESLGPASPKVVGKHLVKALQQHLGGRPPLNDTTLVCVGRTHSPRGTC
jgi:serine phosphatase RsbU (regulator of sigma subunit)